jgi:choice-of-anchor A domain-containing protein
MLIYIKLHYLEEEYVMKGFIKRRPFVKMVALFLCLALCIQGVSTNLKTANAASEAKYDGDFNISTILSRYQYFIQNDVTLNSSGHTVGAVVVGGTLDLANTFGDAAIVPSYINTLKAGYLGNGWSGKYPLKSETIYYVQGTENLYDWQISSYDWIQVGEDYISMTDAFSQIKAQSKSLTEGATKLTAKDGTITIDCTADKDVTYEIAYDDFASNNVNIVVDDVDWFKTNLCIINVTGVNANELTFDGYWPVHVNGSISMDSALEKMSGSDSYFNQQLNVNGMNLIWNFPDATGTLNIQGLGGHLVAPSATVNFNSGNYEGGVIAKELTGGAQGHFYPMSRTLGTVDADETEAGTASLTFSKLDENGNALSGAEISLWYKGDGSLKDVTSTSGHKLSISTKNSNIVWKTTSTPCVLNDLPNGEYSVTETVSPTGYKFAESISFKVVDGKIYLKLANGSYSATALEDNKLSMTDAEKTGKLTLTGSVTVETKGSEPAPSETYTFVVTEDGKTVATGTSNADGTITFTEITYTKEDIGTHTYEITETSGNTTNMT